LKKQIIFGHLLTLFLGGFIYILFRQDNLKMFQWFDAVNMSGIIKNVRTHSTQIVGLLPEWFLYSLPDGLWMFSYISILLVIWNNKVNKNNIYWILVVPIVAILCEFGQLFKFIPGTFDKFDIIFYILGVFIPILIYTNFIKNFKNEKIN
tara:strand:+ start:6960 stop:7409 length:450 start_codon:yes stop_codon:yes gene_type:complete